MTALITLASMCFVHRQRYIYTAPSEALPTFSIERERERSFHGPTTVYIVRYPELKQCITVDQGERSESGPYRNEAVCSHSSMAFSLSLSLSLAPRLTFGYSDAATERRGRTELDGTRCYLAANRCCSEQRPAVREFEKRIPSQNQTWKAVVCVCVKWQLRTVHSSALRMVCEKSAKPLSRSVCRSCTSSVCFTTLSRHTLLGRTKNGPRLHSAKLSENFARRNGKKPEKCNEIMARS